MTHAFGSTRGDGLMKHKPDFARQTAEPMTPKQRHDWIARASREMHKLGAVMLRVTLDDDKSPPVVLVEGWRVAPGSGAELAEPFFFKTKAGLGR